MGQTLSQYLVTESSESQFMTETPTLSNILHTSFVNSLQTHSILNLLQTHSILNRNIVMNIATEVINQHFVSTLESIENIRHESSILVCSFQTELNKQTHTRESIVRMAKYVFDQYYDLTPKTDTLDFTYNASVPVQCECVSDI